MPIGIGAGTAIAAGIGAGASIGTGVYGAKQQGKANQRALSYQEQADQRAMQMERQQLDEQRRQWDAEQANLAEQRTYDRSRLELQDQRREPFRQASVRALGRLSELVSPQGQSQWRSPSQAGRVSMSDLVRR